MSFLFQMPPDFITRNNNMVYELINSNSCKSEKFVLMQILKSKKFYKS